ncbi:hypothetical protein C5167_049282 [Papaver somniferum]|uniref:Uncharacterized protein n=1 Tax=Papaver somniferum TaxID=3469 RepID=A0A4Y7KNQ5_PAPSO|nr:hypothetical protein C5167_049282 [Papaver somniferum]
MNSSITCFFSWCIQDHHSRAILSRRSAIFILSTILFVLAILEANIHFMGRTHSLALLGDTGTFPWVLRIT